MYKKNKREWHKLVKIKYLELIEVIKLEHIIFLKRELQIIELI